MSSVQSAFSQVAPRGKFLVATKVAAAVTGATLGALMTLNSGAVVTSSMSTADFVAATSPGPAAAVGDLYRDIGKTVTVYDADRLLAVAKYQKVQIVSGEASEGVPNPLLADTYALVWMADPVVANMPFARTG